MNIIRLGTRGSKLALAQADLVKFQLEKKHPGLLFEIVVIQTKGDIDLISPLYEIGGKGVFIKELEVALTQGYVDIAVHSLKDMTAALPNHLKLSAFLKAESTVDVLVLGSRHKKWEDLPIGATLATGSSRRVALLKILRPDIQTVGVRGNVLTRIAKLDDGQFDGLVLSEAGLIRLDLQDRVSHRFSPYDFCPAPGQGVIVLESRKNDAYIQYLCGSINDKEQELRSTAELVFLEKVGFDCRAPLGIHIIPGRDKGEDMECIVFLATTKMDNFKKECITLSRCNPRLAMEALAQSFIEWRNQHEIN